MRFIDYYNAQSEVYEDCCAKCDGSGVYVWCSSTEDDTCYCCGGKGWRSGADHARCVRYGHNHPNDIYVCCEFDG